jgi:hypothetical protein
MVNNYQDQLGEGPLPDAQKPALVFANEGRRDR